MRILGTFTAMWTLKSGTATQSTGPKLPVWWTATRMEPFIPTDSITRQEFAQMLYNYAKYKGCDLTAEGDLSQFPDSESVADWAETAMSWVNGNELFNGHDDGTIDAAGIGTRSQAASILMRFDQNLVKN